MTYSDKLKNPMWQRKRLEIMERDEFTCQFCGDTESMLVVHHYKYSGEPWEVDNRYLVTLCKSCHDCEHEEMKDAHKFIDSVMLGQKAITYSFLGHFLNRLKRQKKYDLDKYLIYLCDIIDNHEKEFNDFIDKFKRRTIDE